MQKAYDTILQSEVSAYLAAQNGEFEPYRYECAYCGEEVYIAATHSTSKVPHFRHRNGNNNVECENYLGKYGAISIDARSRKSNRERVELYFEKNTKTFCLGLRFSGEEINVYEQHNVVFELRSSSAEQPFFTLPINNTNFAQDASTLVPINKFSFSYYLSNSLNGTKRKYDFFKPSKTPVFFKLQGNSIDYKAKLVRSTVLYTNVLYFVVFESQYSILQEVCFMNEIAIDESIAFETMNKKFNGIVLIIKNKTDKIEDLLLSWGYQLEASEILTLLWPPAVLVDEVSVIDSEYALLYSSFDIQAHGNINVHSEDIYRVTDGVSRVFVNPKTKVFKKNAEIILVKSEEHAYVFDEIFPTESCASIYTVPDDSTHFLFNRSGVKPLSKGQSVLLTPQAQIIRYYYGYPTDRIYLRQKEELSGENLLKDILSHYRRTEAFDKSVFSSRVLSKTASQYIEQCEASDLINTVAKEFIKEGRL